MPRRGENIHKRKDGRWEGRYKIEEDTAGHAKYRSVYGKTYKEVKAKLIATVQNPERQSRVAGQGLCFGEIVKQWLSTNNVKFKKATQTKYEFLIEKHILPELGEIQITKLTPVILNTFMEKKLCSGRLNSNSGLSPAYVRNIMLVISAALQFAVDEQLCQPKCTQFYKPAAEKKDIRVLNIAEQKRLENLLLSDVNQTKLGVLISLHTGMRIGEVCSLTWDDIDFDEKIIHVRSTVARIKNHDKDSSNKTVLIIDRPKTKASLRDIPIPSILQPIMWDLKQQRTSRYVISDTPSFVSPRTYEYRYHRLLDACGISSVNYHVLRHTFATRCIEVGVDVKSLSEILGHANVSVTLNTYVHSSMELKRKQLEKLTTL